MKINKGQTKPQHSIAQHSTVNHCTGQYSTSQYNTVQYTTAHYSTLQHSTAQYSTVQFSAVQHSTAQYGTVQHSTAQYCKVQHSTARYSTVQHGTTQYSPIQFITVHQTNRLKGVPKNPCRIFPKTPEFSNATVVSVFWGVFNSGTQKGCSILGYPVLSPSRKYTKSRLFLLNNVTIRASARRRVRGILRGTMPASPRAPQYLFLFWFYLGSKLLGCWVRR